MAVKFERVALPIGFDSLSVEEQHDIAEELAGEHFKQFCRKLPYEEMIERYRLFKNGNVFAVINVADFA